MRGAWRAQLILGLITSTRAFSNSTMDENTIPGIEEGRWDMAGSCSAGRWDACFEGGVLASVSAMVGKEFRFSNSARLLRANVSTANDSPRPRSDSEGVFSRLARAGDEFIRTAGLEIALTPDITEGGRYQPRFIDEIYTELDTLQLKHAKPSKQSELKRLFIPLLVILKVFKLKLLLLLPIILGLASFKKLIAILVMLVPAVIAYFKVCKPDLGQGYGSYGHSSYYQPPSSLSSHQEYGPDGSAYDRMSYRHRTDLPYRAYSSKP